MPTEDRNLAEVLRALLSVGAVTIESTHVGGGGHRLSAYLLTVNASVVIDGEHEWAVQKVLDP